MPAPAPDAFVLWLLPGLFLLHDLEETLWLPQWLHRHRELLAARFPRLAARILPHTARLGRGAFALMAGEELILLTVVTACACRSGHYALWLALFLAFTLHLCLHVGRRSSCAACFRPPSRRCVACPCAVGCCIGRRLLSPQPNWPPVPWRAWPSQRLTSGCCTGWQDDCAAA